MADTQCGTLASIIALIQARAPACGTTKVVAVDGPSGAGKSTLAQLLSERLNAPVLSMEGIYRGWYGLQAGADVLVDDVLRPIAVGAAGRHREWDWGRQGPGPDVHTPAWPVLIVDGVGSGSAHARVYTSVLIWLDAERAVRRQRALGRDAGTIDAWWDTWADNERAYFARNKPEAASDIRIRTDAVA